MFTLAILYTFVYHYLSCLTMSTLVYPVYPCLGYTRHTVLLGWYILFTQGATRGYWGFEGVTGAYKGLQGVTGVTKTFRGLEGFNIAYGRS